MGKVKKLDRYQRYRLRHPEKTRQHLKNYRLNHPEKIREFRKRYYEKHKEEIKKKSRDFFYKNRGKVLKKRKKYREKNREKILAVQRLKYKEYFAPRNHRYKLKRYGIDECVFNKMRDDQKNSCAICEMKFSKKRLPYIDHCHKTNVVRGLLCRQCNFWLGILEKQDFVRKATKYLAMQNRVEVKQG